MSTAVWRWLIVSLVINFSAGWMNERPVLESENGNLFISSAKDKNITLKTLGSGNININDINLLQAVWAAQNASNLINRWKYGILDDVESTLQRLTHIVEGPNGLVRKLNALEFPGDSTVNASSISKPTSDTKTAVSPTRIRTISSRLRRLENKVRTITVKLRTNNCASDPCQNGGTCINGYDSFQCHCPPQWEGAQCSTDVNECEQLGGRPGGCQNGATCVNLPGSFRCNCPSGWHGFHCSTQKSACDQSNDDELCGNGICIKSSSPLGYNCICKTGWDHSGDNDPSCRKDIDECSSQRYPCSVNPLVTCHNVPGAFYCGTCPAGYKGDGFKCQDIDECLVNNGGCSTAPFVECINTLGSRKCGTCPSGYQGDGVSCNYLGSTCNDNNGGCHSLATCREGPNSQSICVCPPGYQGLGRGPQGCIPSVNACKNNPCGHGTCHPHGLNRYTCNCDRGYTGAGCDVALNLCIPNPCKNNGTCLVTVAGRSYCECTSSFTGTVCDKPRQTCGGFFRKPSGYVEFPIGAGNKYDPGLSCAWVLLTNQSMVLNVTFTRFSLESSHGEEECKHDYVQIHDGRSAGSNILGRYCGNKLPNNGTIISTHNSIYIWFNSDSTINRDGFAFNWTSKQPTCGGELNEEYGSISSPGYPGKYPTNRDCYWHINVQPGKRIALHFINLMLEEHQTCANDYLEVNETNYIGQTQLGLFCNHTKPAPITTSGSHVTIHFHSDGSETDTGFYLSFLSIAGSPDCGGIFTTESGEITSPGYHSGNYKAGLICEWEIRLPQDSHVKLNWLHFEIEPSRNCMFDSVEVFQGTTTDSPLVGRYCGSKIPPTLSIKSNKVLIRFQSDNSLEDGGFVLKYEVECGGVFTEPSGIITSPYYPNYYPASKDCVYLISQPPGKAVVLTFQFMDIEEGTTLDNETRCYFDRIEIRDGDTGNSTLLSSLCGSAHFMPQNPIISTHNFMFIEFFTDANIHNLGFKVNYTTIDRECGGILKQAPGTLNMPGIGKTWRYKADCLWTIRAPLRHAIQITWLAYPTRQSYVTDDCGSSYLELVEDYGSSNPKSLGKYCPLRSPPQIMTTQGNDLTLHYKFSGDISDLNYEATYVFVNETHNCGGHYYAETGTIRSPNYPDKYYPRNKECIWIIEAKNKYLVTLTVKSFVIENSPKCAFDFLEIRSGSQENSPLIGRFCGDTITQEITSMTNQMYVKFVSDTSLQDVGFEIEWHSTKTGCGGSLRTSSGSIMSPNYPQNYYHRATCSWDIRVAAGSAIQLTFVDFDLEDHIKCGFDYLEVSDIINGYVQNPQRFCGTNYPSHLESNTNHIKILFRSDVLTSSRGFHLRYATNCSNKVTGFQGVIESPNFPNSYDNLSNCSWIISVPPGNAVNITFSHFSIQKDDDGNCTKDYLRLQEGDNDQPNTEIMKKCGYEDELPLKISSTQRQVFVSFISDRTVVLSGFRLEWYVDGCSKHFTKPNGHFESPGFPNGNKFTHPTVNCEWLIEVDSDHSIELTFPQLETTRNHACSSGFESSGSVEIYNGQDDTAPPLAHNLCYSSIPVTYTSSGNRLFVKYSQDTVYASYGFQAVYRSVAIKCGGKFTGQSGAIHSPNYPKNYPSNQQCEWLITVDRDHAVNLTFVDLDFEATRNCTNDYIKIYDGNSKEAPLITTYCRNGDASTYIVSSGNTLLVEMRTDESVTAKGFRALYNRTCGARIAVDSSGILRSSSTLHTLDSSNCSWILTAADPGDKVTLSFSHIDLLEGQDCSENYLAVYDGEGTDGTLLGKICDNQIPIPFTSTGNALTVHLASTYGPSIGDKFDASYSTLSTACGGIFRAESGMIATPNYPLSYPSKADCIWILQNAPGNRLSLTFEDFELNESENCDVDYMEIRENNAIGKLRGIYCGKNVESITSSQPIWIKFKSASNSIGNPKGFKAQYNYLFGDEITGDSGEIASPTYPLNYRKTSTFTWRITVDFNYAIEIEMIELNFDSYEEYCYTSLKIYDGYNVEAPQLKELCGIQVPDEKITSTSNIVFIEFDSAYDPVGNLFRLKWTKVPKANANIDMEIHPDPKNEVIILTRDNGSYAFHSPGYPGGYENNLRHSWTFISPLGTHILLKFLTINIEEVDNCFTDYIAIYNGHVTTFDPELKPLHKLCLSNSTTENYPGTNIMTVQFVTDVSQNKSGFSAVALTECGGLFEKSSGIITVNNTNRLFASPKPYIYNCEWVVKVRSGRRIAVTVISNKIDNSQKAPDDNSCRSNYLILKNGETSSSPLLGTGKYCNGVIPPVQNTSSNYLYVKLAVSFAMVDFKLQFKELGHDCGGRFILNKETDLKQQISSPNYPNIPSPHIECIWTFMSADENRLSIHFLERFDLAFSEDCEKEYVEIRDGGTEMSTLLGRYCKNAAPSTISSKGNLMYVRYYTDLSEPRNGFKALITTGEVCGGIERESRGGVITSPNWPETYDFKAHSCSWWIMAPSPNRAIKLQFQDLELPIRRNCSTTDHIAIYEQLPGNLNTNATKIGTYCGRKNPGVIDIVTSEALVVFRSSFVGARLSFAKGFRLNYTFNTDGCGGSFNGMSGIFQTNGYPRPHALYKYCHWKISVPLGYQVKVDILDLDIGGGPTYSSIGKYSMRSRATFHHDPDSIAIIASLNDNDKQSMSIYSSSNYMSIYYISTGGSRGMKAKYTALFPAPCGRESNNWEDTFRSPTSAPYNETAFYCAWSIKPPETTYNVNLTLSLTISGMINKGKGSMICRNYLSYIMIKGDEPIAKICGNLTKDVITVSSPFKTHTIEALNASSSAVVNFTISYKWNKCGGILTGPSHVLRAPKNISYPAHCSWKVKYPNIDDTMLLSFEKMNLGCEKSYIQIKGRSYRSPTIGKFCGNVKPANIITPTNEITIEYYATEDVGDFELHLGHANYACGGKLKGKRTDIRSPGFPNNYSNNTECIWEITANVGYHVGLTFVERFHLETSTDCVNDYVEIYDWRESLQNNTDHWYRIGKVCGRVPPAKPFNSTTNRMMVKFVTNDKIEGEGFAAVWNSNCGGIYDVTNTEKYLESPNFLGMYPPNSYCNYTLIAPNDKDIIVDFTYFSIEGNSVSCNFDNVTIYFYQGDWMRGENTWCGTNSPGRKMAKGRMEIIFSSDNSVSRAGFKFKYSLNDCGGVITSPTMIHPTLIKNDDSFGYTNCVWTVVAPLKKSVLLRFEEFNISQPFDNCIVNSVQIYEGNSTDKYDRKAKFCGDLSYSLPVLQSIKNVMTISFEESSYETRETKLKAAVLFVNGPEQGCGGNINVTREREFKTQTSEYYEPSQDCHWLINSPPGTFIQFTINEIDFKNTTFNDTLIVKKMACNSDYLEIRDGGPFAEIIGHYCGSTPPPPISSTANLIWIRFVSDGVNEGRGVKATLKAMTSPCGMTDLYINNETQTLTSPNYPNALPSDIACRWTIRERDIYEYKRIKITFRDFNLDDSEKCDREYVQIADVNSRKIITEGFGEQFIVGGIKNHVHSTIYSSHAPQSYYKYCGIVIPHDYYSNYKNVEITYKAVGNRGKKGFRLEYGQSSCSRRYTSIQGRIINDDISDCHITIEVPKNSTISLYFNNFFLPGKTNCTHAAMEIRDGGPSGNIIQSVCNFEIPNPVFSTGNVISIHVFMKGEIIQSNSYDITYTSSTQGRGCGGKLYNYGGTFASPFYPNAYRNRSVCVWEISVPRGMKISLGFSNFDIGPKNMCETNYLTISEGKTSGSEDVVTYCGGDIPAEYTSQNDQVLVTYSTSVNNGGSGWIGHFAAL